MGQRDTEKASIKTSGRISGKYPETSHEISKSPSTGHPEATEEIFVNKISVRNLVEFILRSGDITTSGSGLRDTEAMQEGTRIHQKLQRRMGSRYQAEVSLSSEFFIAADSEDRIHISNTNFSESADVPPQKKKEMQKSLRFRILLEGRADGIFSDGTGMVIDEIKSVYKDIFSMKEPVPVHLAQALCYAYLYAKQKQLQEIGVRMTYCHIPTEKVRYFTEHRTLKELERWFYRLLREYAKWCVWQLRWKEARNSSVKKLRFPFSYRPGQEDLVKSVYVSISRKKRLYIEAPTGVGKTISTVFPAVKSIGEELTEKIFYLTAKTVTRTVAEETFSILEKKKTFLKYVTITAKEKICILEKPACNPESCERAKGHFDRINDAMYDLLTHENHISRECIID
ncbi:MAG: PD-(D/E)XK nuclease family protein [Lachnospiraceae bacterium]|nr:PD-(D/E)XK nuclease family protein [Lachnospiraceae bacterium]